MHPTPLPNRRQHLACLCALATLLAAGAAHAESVWPSKPITLVVPFAAGGTTDVLARALGERLSQRLGQAVIVENKPGAGATLGADMVAKSKPDGHTLLMGAVHHTIAPAVYRKLPYDLQHDFAPLSTIALVPNVLVVNAAATPAKTVRELVALAKAQGGFTYGSNGNGTAQHLIGTQFENLTGVELAHVPYKGSGPLTTDLLGGQIKMSFDTVTPVLQHIRSGKLRALAVTTARRSSALPDVPTMEEAGLKGLNIGTWFGVLAPVATPKEITVRLSGEIQQVVQSAQFRQRLTEIGAEPVGNTPEQMSAQIKAEVERFAGLVKAAKVTLE